MRRREIHEIIELLERWYQGWTNLNEIDWILTAPVGTIGTLFLENELADVEGRPLDGRTVQDAINVLCIFLAMRQRAPVKAKPHRR